MSFGAGWNFVDMGSPDELTIGADEGAGVDEADSRSDREGPAVASDGRADADDCREDRSAAGR